MSSSHLSLRHLFGLKGDAKSNLHYLDEQHIIYAAGYNVIIYNTEKKIQRFLTLTGTTTNININNSSSHPAAVITATPPGTAGDNNRARTASIASLLSSSTSSDHPVLVPAEITCLAVSVPKHSHAKGKLLAVAEHRRTGNPHLVINIYDVNTMKKTGKAPLLLTTDTGPIISIAFSPDSKTLLSLTAPPNPTLTLWNWEKGKIITSTIIPVSASAAQSFFLTQPSLLSKSNLAPHTSMISFCPTDPSVICLSGIGLLRFLHLEGNDFRSIAFSMGKKNNLHTTTQNNKPSSSSGNREDNYDNSNTRDIVSRSGESTSVSSNKGESGRDGYTCHVWLDDRLVLGTRDGSLHLFENAEYRGVLATSPALLLPAASTTAPCITSLCAISKGFICGCEDGLVIMFERDDKEIYKQKKCFQVKPDHLSDDHYDTQQQQSDSSIEPTQSLTRHNDDDDSDSDDDEGDDDINHNKQKQAAKAAEPPPLYVTNLALSPTEDNLIISLSCHLFYLLSFNHQQDMSSIAALSALTNKQQKERYTQQMLTSGTQATPRGNGTASSSSSGTASQNAQSNLFDALASCHSASIVSMDISVRKPFLITASSDHTVKVWHYLHKSLEFSTTFPSAPISLTFHPNGYYVLITFIDCIHLYSLYMDHLQFYRSFPIKSCTGIKFCHGGQFFAAIAYATLYVYETFSCRQLLCSTIHKQKIMNLQWNENDTEIVSISRDGYVYQTIVTQQHLVIQSTSSSNTTGSTAGIQRHIGHSGTSVLIAKYKCILSHIQLGNNYYVSTNEHSIKILQPQQQSILQQQSLGGTSSSSTSAGLLLGGLGNYSSSSNSNYLTPAHGGNATPAVNAVLQNEIYVGTEITALMLLHHHSHTAHLMNSNSSTTHSTTSTSSSSFTLQTPIGASSSSLTHGFGHKEKLLIVGTVTGHVTLYSLPYDIHSPVYSLQLFTSPITQFTVNLEQTLLFVGSAEGGLAMMDLDKKNHNSHQQLLNEEVSKPVVPATPTNSTSSTTTGTTTTITTTATGNTSNNTLLNFSEESLVSSSALYQQYDLLASLQQTLIHLTQSHDAALFELESAYKKKLTEISEQAENELSRDRQAYKAAEESKSNLEKLFHQKEQELKNLYITKRTELYEHHHMKMSMEQERLQELLQKIENEKKQFEWNLQAAQQQSLIAHNTLNREMQTLMEATQQEREILTQQHRAKIIQYEGYRDALESDLDQEMSVMKYNYHQKLHIEKMSTQQLKEQHSTITMQYSLLKKELQSNEQMLHTHQQHYTQLSSTYQNLHLSLITLEKENQERSAILAEKDVRIFELKKKNQELEKFRFVLDYKIVELKRLIAPKKNELLQLYNHEQAMQKELHYYIDEQKKLQLECKIWKMKLIGLEKEGMGMKVLQEESNQKYMILCRELSNIARMLGWNEQLLMQQQKQQQQQQQSQQNNNRQQQQSKTWKHKKHRGDGDEDDEEEEEEEETWMYQ